MGYFRCDMIIRIPTYLHNGFLNPKEAEDFVEETLMDQSKKALKLKIIKDIVNQDGVHIQGVECEEISRYTAPDWFVKRVEGS